MNGFGEIGRNGRFFGQNDKLFDQNGENEIFLKNPQMSLPYTHKTATLCKKVKKSYERILRSRSDGRTNKSESVGHKSTSRYTKKIHGVKMRKRITKLTCSSQPLQPELSMTSYKRYPSHDQKLRYKTRKELNYYI